MTDTCLFCRIVNGDIPAQIVHEDDDIVAFYDIAPQAPVHVLLIPRRHLDSVSQFGDDDAGLAGKLLLTARTLARQLGMAESGFRLVINTGDQGGQSVSHLHLHLLGGRQMTWPPG